VKYTSWARHSAALLLILSALVGKYEGGLVRNFLLRDLQTLLVLIDHVSQIKKYIFSRCARRPSDPQRQFYTTIINTKGITLKD